MLLVVVAGRGCAHLPVRASHRNMTAVSMYVTIFLAQTALTLASRRPQNDICRLPCHDYYAGATAADPLVCKYR